MCIGHILSTAKPETDLSRLEGPLEELTQKIRRILQRKKEAITLLEEICGIHRAKEIIFILKPL